MEKTLSNISGGFSGFLLSMRKPATRVISGIGLMIMCLAALLAYNLNRLGDIANGMGALCVDIDNFSIFTMVLLSACFSFCALHRCLSCWEVLCIWVVSVCDGA
jgi:predicted ferric reductase